MCNVEGPPLKKRKPQPLPPTEPFPIYLDYNATTPLSNEAWQAMVAVRSAWGNPSSSHPYGLAAKYALEAARTKMQHALNAPSANSIVFTSGGTESNNLAILGGCHAVRAKEAGRQYIITTNVEHPAVVEVVKSLGIFAGASFHALLAPVNIHTGSLDSKTLEEVLKKVPGGPRAVALVTVMFANNELGSVNAISSLVRVTKRLCGEACLFHTDAAQTLGKIRVDIQETGVDLLSVCAHKFYGPKGVGALFIKPGVRIQNILYGAPHEQGIRPGTENVLLVTGMAEALSHACANLDTIAAHMRSTRDELGALLKAELAKYDMGFVVNGDISIALPNTLNCALFKKTVDRKAELPVTYISAARLILTVGDRVCMSAGSACHSTAGDEEITLSTPLQAVGVDLNRAIGTLRLSTGRDTTFEEVRRAAKIIARHAALQFAE